MRCYNCGSEMPANLSFCIHCARRMVFPFPPFNRFALAKKEVTLPCNLSLDEVDIRIFQSCFNNVLFNLRGRNVYRMVMNIFYIHYHLHLLGVSIFI